MDEWTLEQPLETDDRSGLVDQLLTGECQRHVVDVLGPLAGVADSTFAWHAPSGPEVQRGSGQTRDDAARAARLARPLVEQFDGYAALAAEAERAAAQPDVEQTRARLVAIAAGVQEPLPPGQKVPYVRLREPPTLVGAARVHSLSKEQSEPFFLLADTLEREARGERCPQVRTRRFSDR